MIEGLVIAVITVASFGTVTETLGPNKMAQAETVAVVSERTGEVLYYNTK